MKDRREEKHKYYEANKERIIKKSAQWRKEHPGADKRDRRNYSRDYFKKNKEQIRLYQHKWYEANKEIAKARAIVYRLKYPEKLAAKRKRVNLKYKTDALTHYSLDKKPMCGRCGISDLDVLTIDHINGGGTKKRRDKVESVNTYFWLKRNNWPKGYQVLCANCNLKKRIREGC